MTQDRAEQIIDLLAEIMDEIRRGRVRPDRMGQIGRELDQIEFELDVTNAR